MQTAKEDLSNPYAYLRNAKEYNGNAWDMQPAPNTHHTPQVEMLRTYHQHPTRTHHTWKCLGHATSTQHAHTTRGNSKDMPPAPNTHTITHTTCENA